MKIKINWGTGIVIAMVLFMIFILQFVYRVTFMDKYDHHLVSDDYYRDELHFQEEIDKEENAKTLDQNLVIESTQNGIELIFPENMEDEQIEGTAYFKRLSNDKLDFKKEIRVQNHRFTIPKDNLVEGKWEVKIDWKYKGKEYMLKKSVFY